MLNELSARFMTWVARARDDEGQGLVEYALILSLVSIASITVLGVVGVDVDEVLDTVETALNGVG
jgi:Flp pilus assembly pilin Flp